MIKPTLAPTCGRRAALVGYLPAGYPTVEGAIAALGIVATVGADVVEVGWPYADPTMDGPDIRRAHQAALAGGFTPLDVLRTVAEVTRHEKPVVVMTYRRPVEEYGVAKFARDLAAAGGVGIVVADLPATDAGLWANTAVQNGLDLVLPVHPDMTARELRPRVWSCLGWVYAATTNGTTGAPCCGDDERSRALVSQIRTFTELPVAVGFGIRDPVRAAAIAEYADGVVVGTALVQELVTASSLPTGLVGLARTVSAFAAAVHGLQGSAR